MSNRARIQRIREETADTVKSFEKTFKEIDRLVEANASDDEINAVVMDSGIPSDAFIDAYQRYDKAGGIVDFGAGRSLLQGLTFGFADELEAAFKSATGDRTYEQEVGAIRAGQKAFEAARPMEALGAEAIGSLPYMALPMVGGARVAQIAGKAPSLARTMGYGMGIGATEGVIGGLGRGETAEEMGQRALVEGGIGAGLGALAPVAVTGGARLLRSGRQADTRATEQIGRLFPEDGMSEAQQAVQQRIDIGDETPVTLTDIGGTEAQRELRGLRGGQPEVQAMTDDFLRERTRTQGTRVEREIERGAGVSPEESVVLGNVIDKQESAAAPLYQKLRENNREVSISGMESEFRKPAFGAVYQRAVNAMINRSDKGVDPEAIKKMSDMSYDDFLEMIEKNDAFVPFDFLDQSKRQLDSLGQAAKRQGDDDLASQYFDVARRIRDEADDRVSGYKQAREVFAGEKAIEDAMDMGNQFDNKTPAELRELMEQMNGSEKRAFLTGAVDSIRKKIGQARRDRDTMTALNLDAPFQEERLAIIMGGRESPAFKAFMDALKTEGRMAQTRGVVAGGSQTAAFQRDIGRAGIGFDEVIDVIMNPASVTNVGALTRLFQGTINRLKGTGGDVGQRVASQLLDVDPQQQMATLRAIDNLRRQQANTARVIQSMGLGASGTAGIAPSLLDAGE